MNKKQKKMLIRIAITAVMLIALAFLPLTGIWQLLAYVAAYLVIGYDILRKAGIGIIHGRAFDECFLMAIATLGAFFLAVWTKSGDYVEGISVMLFYQIGELFQSYAVGKSRRNISALMDIRPDYANIEKDGKLEQVDPDEVTVGSIIVAARRKGPAGRRRRQRQFHPEHQRPDGREPPPRCCRGRRDHQRLHQHERRSENSYHEGLRRIHGLENS